MGSVFHAGMSMSSTHTSYQGVWSGETNAERSISQRNRRFSPPASVALTGTLTIVQSFTPVISRCRTPST